MVIVTRWGVDRTERERERRRESSSGSTRNTRGCERQIAALTAHTLVLVMETIYRGFEILPLCIRNSGGIDSTSTRRGAPVPFFRFTKKFRGLGHAVGSRFTKPFVRDYECSPPPDDDDAPYISPYTVCVRAKAPRHKTRERYRTDERRHRVRERSSVQSVIRRGETVRQALPTNSLSLLL